MRKRAIKNLDAMCDPFVGPRLASEMLEDFRRERLYAWEELAPLKYLSVKKIFRDIASVRK